MRTNSIVRGTGLLLAALAWAAQANCAQQDAGASAKKLTAPPSSDSATNYREAKAIRSHFVAREAALNPESWYFFVPEGAECGHLVPILAASCLGQLPRPVFEAAEPIILGTRYCFLLVPDGLLIESSFCSRQTDTCESKESAMERAIRVLVANRPRLMREVLLATLADQPWIEVVGEVPESGDISEHVNKSLPDLLVIALEEPEKRPTICDALLHMHPELRIIAVAPHKNCSIRYWASFEIHSDDVEPSEEGFLNAVRNIATEAGGVS